MESSAGNNKKTLHCFRLPSWLIFVSTRMCWTWIFEVWNLFLETFKSFWEVNSGPVSFHKLNKTSTVNQIAFINSSIMLRSFLRISHPKSNYVSQMRCDEIEMTILTLQSTLPTTRWTSSSSTKAFIHYLSITGHQQVRRNFWCSTLARRRKESI